MIAPTPLILAFGDSLVAGYGLARADCFPQQLQRALRVRHPEAGVVNAGVSGDTTASALQRLPRVLAALAKQPDLAIIQLGANDVLRGVAPALMREHLDRIVTEFARCGIRVLLATLTPPPFLHDRVGVYLEVHREVARQHRLPVCDFFPAGVLGRSDMVLADRLHPNARAIAAVVEHMLPTIEAALTPDRAIGVADGAHGVANG